MLMRGCVAVLLSSLAIGPVAFAETFDPGGMNSMQLLPTEQRARVPEDVEVTVWPTGILDAGQTHYITANSPTIVILAVANPKERVFKKGWMVVDVPVGVELIGTNDYLPWHLKQPAETIEHDGKRYARHVFNCSVHPTTIPRGGIGNTWFGRYRPPAVWLKTDRAEGSSLDPLRVTFRYQEEGQEQAVDSPAFEQKLAVSAPIEAQQPKLVDSGVMGRFILNGSAELGETLHAYFAQLGYSYVVQGPRIKALRDDLERWTEAPVQNAYHVASTQPVPEEIEFISEGKAMPRAVTPSAFYKGHPWIEENVFAEIQRRLVGYTDQYKIYHNSSSFLINWEPYVYLKTGDQSDRNRAEFIEWSKLPADEVTAAWPDGIKAKWPKQFHQFNNWQVGQVMKTLATRVHEMSQRVGKDARIGIWAGNDNIYAEPGDDSVPMRILEWGDMPIDVVTWQYFDVPNAHAPFPTSDRMGAAQVVRSARVASWVDEKLGVDRQMRVGCLYGWDQTGGRAGFFLPEQLGFLHLSGILGGSEIIQNYAEYPIWDGRYATEIAKANTRIARWEEFIINGKRQHAHTLVPQSPYPQEVLPDVTPAEQELKSDWAHPGYLFSFEFTKGDQRLITVANTWDYGDVFFLLRFPSLPAGQYQLTEPEEKRLFANDDGQTSLSAEDLAKGVLVHVGATRWGAFVLEPHRQANDGLAIVTSQAVREAMLSRKPALDEAVERDERKYAQDFDAAELGVIKITTHGQKIVDGSLAVGRPGKRPMGEDLAVKVLGDAAGRKLALIDKDPADGLYLALQGTAAEGEIFFDYQLLNGAGRASMGISAYAAVLTVPTESQWNQWFAGTPYRSNFVYLEGVADGPGYPDEREAFTAVDTGLRAEAGRTYRMCWRWTTDRRASIVVDDQPIVTDRPFLSRKGDTASFRWSTAAFAGTPADNGGFSVDEIRYYVRKKK